MCTYIFKALLHNVVDLARRQVSSLWRKTFVCHMYVTKGNEPYAMPSFTHAYVLILWCRKPNLHNLQVMREDHRATIAEQLQKIKDVVRENNIEDVQLLIKTIEDFTRSLESTETRLMPKIQQLK
jgi:hypothetical protein